MSNSEPKLTEGRERSLDGYVQEPTDFLEPEDYVNEIHPEATDEG